MPKPVSRLILPNDPVRRGGLTIHVPRGYETEDDRRQAPEGYMICRVLVDDQDTICGKVFEPGEERGWVAHMTACAAEHIDVIRAQSPLSRMPVFDPQNWDPEVYEHMQDVGKKMLAEGRWEVKPSERAGFS